MKQIPVKLITLGCPKNYVDSEIIKDIFTGSKYRIVDGNENPDIVVVNTCGFIEDAKKESIEVILETVRLKNEKKIKKLIVTGCLSQRYREQLLEEIPEIDFIFGVNDFSNLYSTLYNDFPEKPLTERKLITPKHYAYLKIAEGCDNLCSYCIIPFIRGRFKSREINSLVKEAETLATNGVKELILIAEDTTSYGIDIYGKRKLPYLLEKLTGIDKLKWIRILYAYPGYVDDELIKFIAENKKICRYIDIPVQHVSNKILKMMGRKYNKDFLLKLIEKIRKKIPDIGLRTTVITGFPGETMKDFNELLSFIEYVKFDRLGVFTYSREEGTKAYYYKDQLSKKEKEERAEEIKWLQKEISLKKNQTLIGEKLNVIIDSCDNVEKVSTGRTEKDSPEIDNKVLIKKKLKPGQFYKATITEASDFDLIGY
ncbi:30S ribosomal protein S12 methylthiotransferase RimO [candidate division KSB1 bacterium]|nr:MAG: 30S ribosomal protein S12 methylthiotransferase RimO [candidate division KSB1 bacterium]